MTIARMKFILVSTLFIFGAIVPQVGQAKESTWRLDPEASQLTFTSSKDDAVPVGGSFSGVSGTIKIDQKKASASGGVKIDLKTLETGDVVRDNNIKSVFFGVTAEGAHHAVFQLDAIQGEYDALFGKPAAGSFQVSGTLKIKDATAALSFPVAAVKQKNGKIRLFTTTPVPVRFADLQLGDAAEVLKKVCGHAALLELATISAAFVLQAE